MTTIAFKDGILAYDSRMTLDGGIIGNVNKGCKTNDHLVAVCGDADCISRFIKWAKTGFNPKKAPKFTKTDDFEAVVIDREKHIMVYDRRLDPLEIETRTYAAGSGAAYANGAMHVGASAHHAVIAAAAFDTGTGGRVRVLSFEE